MVLLAACSDPPATGWTGTVRDSAGVTIVESPAYPVESTAPALVRQLSIGNDESVPETLFGNVAGAVTGADGRIYVLDQQAQTVRVFNPDGSVSASLGGPGQGPGELGQLATSIIAVGDTVMVSDWVNARMAIWGPTDEVIPSRPLPLPAPARSWWRTGADGGIWFRALRRTLSEDNRWGGEDYLLRWDPLTESADTIHQFIYTESDLGGRGEPRLPPVVNAPVWTVLPGGEVAIADLESSEIRILGRDGALTRILRVEGVEPEAPGIGDRAALIEALRNRLAFLGGDPATVDNIPVTFPPVLPTWTDLHAAPDGRLWAQRRGAIENVHPMSLNTPDPPVGWGGTEWYVFGADGRFARQVTLPERSRLMEMNASPGGGVSLLLGEWDSNGVEVVTRVLLANESAAGSEP